MYCTKCGKFIPDDSRTCPLCGCDLSYESNTLRNELPLRKDKKKKSSSHAGGILVACAAIAVAAECVYLLGFAPVHIAPGAVLTDSPALSSQGVTELIPTVDTASEHPAAQSVFSIADPTPTPFVTPIAAAGTVSSPSLSEGLAEPAPAEEYVPVPTEEPETEPAPEPTPEPTASPVVTSSSQLIPGSSSEPLSESDLEGLSAEEVRIARNEIYARHGLIFQSEDLQEYFSSQDWYQGTTTDADSISLSEVEIENIEKIVDYEETMDLN